MVAKVERLPGPALRTWRTAYEPFCEVRGEGRGTYGRVVRGGVEIEQSGEWLQISTLEQFRLAQGAFVLRTDGSGAEIEFAWLGP